MIDKEEIAMKMQLPIHVPEEITIEDSASVSVSETVTDSQITVTKNDSCVPDSPISSNVPAGSCAGPSRP